MVSVTTAVTMDRHLITAIAIGMVRCLMGAESYVISPLLVTPRAFPFLGLEQYSPIIQARPQSIAFSTLKNNGVEGKRNEIALQSSNNSDDKFDENDNDGASNGAVSSVVEYVGLASQPVVWISLYSVATTGGGLPAGPGGSIGALEGLSYLIVLVLALLPVSTTPKINGAPDTPNNLEATNHSRTMKSPMAFGKVTAMAAIAVIACISSTMTMPTEAWMPPSRYSRPTTLGTIGSTRGLDTHRFMFDWVNNLFGDNDKKKEEEEAAAKIKAEAEAKKKAEEAAAVAEQAAKEKAEAEARAKQKALDDAAMLEKAKAEAEAKFAEFEAQQKAEQEAIAAAAAKTNAEAAEKTKKKEEEEAAAEAEAMEEAKAAAEAEAKKKAEEEAAAKAAVEIKAAAEAETEARQKAEEEATAKAKAAEEAKAAAEAEAKKKAEEEAAAKAAAETKTAAEAKAKQKADEEAAAKAQAEAKVDAKIKEEEEEKTAVESSNEQQEISDEEARFNTYIEEVIAKKTRIKGVVQWYNPKKGFGFIKPFETSDEEYEISKAIRKELAVKDHALKKVTYSPGVYVHHHAIYTPNETYFRKLYARESVELEVCHDNEGRPTAKDVKGPNGTNVQAVLKEQLRRTDKGDASEQPAQ
eukprot:jgi/Psemu1/19448/gm1.19448_g